MKRIMFLPLLVALLPGCRHNNEETLYPQPANTMCDTVSVKYKTAIVPVLKQHCLDCHSGQATGGAGINFDNYTSVKAFLDGQKNYFISSITHDGNASEMPMSAPKLDDCTIAKIKIWINAGYPDN